MIKGFSRLPPEFHEKGYIKSGLAYYLDKKLKNKRVANLIVDPSQPTAFKKKGGRFEVVINYQDLKSLKKKMGSLMYEQKLDKSNLFDTLFHQLFPKEFDEPKLSVRDEARRTIGKIDEKIIPNLTKDEIEHLVSFFETLLKQKYQSSSNKRKLLRLVKIRVDDVGINAIIQEFNKNLSTNPTESEWGKYLQQNLFLIDSKYIKVIPQLNVVLAGTRKVDFGLVDSQGYMDIFEIKKPTTPLLASSEDRGNYYWSSHAIKAVVQAEKYLYNAERKAPSLTEDVKRERGVKVNIIKPRAFIVIGHSKQLANAKQKQDFRIIRSSLKNIEIILYDELLQRLKNQKNKVFLE